MNAEQAKAYAENMTYSEAVSNLKYAKGVRYRKDTKIKLRELAEIADALDRKDEPQKRCHRPSDIACHPEQGDVWCGKCEYWYADEPQEE